MRVLLLHPPGSYKKLSEGGESLGLGYVAAVLRRDGHEVEILDANAQCMGVGEAVREILTRDFDCLGVTALHEFRNHVISVIQAVRRKKKDALITVGGYLPSLETEQFLAKCPEADFLVRGEGEIVIADVLGRIERAEDWRCTPGIAYRGDGVVVTNPSPPLIQDLDSLPFPARDSLIHIPTLQRPTIAGSRGCYHSCSFCSINTFYGLSGTSLPRFRSPESVVDEIESVIASTGRTAFAFVDDDFIGPGEKCRERAIRIAEEIRARKLGITFSIESRADEVDEDILKLMKECGLTGLFLGIESGSQRQLDTYNKRITSEQNRRAIDAVRNLDLSLSSGMIIFDPYTTTDDMMENLKFIQETRACDNAALESRVILYRGAPLTERARADGLLIEKGLDVDYRFKDRKIAMLWRALRAFMACTAFVKRLKSICRRGQKKASSS